MHPLSPEALKLAKAVPNFKCPACGEFNSRVVRPMPDNAGEVIARMRECLWCRFRFRTEERISPRKRRNRN